VGGVAAAQLKQLYTFSSYEFLMISSSSEQQQQQHHHHYHGIDLCKVW
jgi:hypothetical protein